MSEYLNIDCNIYMKSVPDKYFDIAIVDPPYALKVSNKMYKEKYNYRQWPKKEWDEKIPEQSYFDELFRISKNQIIWGGNYFINRIKKNSKCILIWDKGQRELSFLADGEMAWTSYTNGLRIFSFSRGLNNSKNRLHQTQKPIELYLWILEKFAKRGDKIFDSHVGSASSLIAFEELGFEYVGCEIDPDYYKESRERLEKYKSQKRLFSIETIQNDLFAEAK